MGHVRELITVDVYGDNTNIIPEEMPELISYMEEVMPKKSVRHVDSEGFCHGQILNEPDSVAMKP